MNRATRTVIAAAALHARRTPNVARTAATAKSVIAVTAEMRSAPNALADELRRQVDRGLPVLPADRGGRVSTVVNISEARR